VTAEDVLSKQNNTSEVTASKKSRTAVGDSEGGASGTAQETRVAIRPPTPSAEADVEAFLRSLGIDSGGGRLG
jgi:hypothetical protein